MEPTQLNHPALENFLVLSNLVKYLKFKDVKNFRLVSKFWNEASKSHFVNSSVISLHDQHESHTAATEKLKKYLNLPSEIRNLFVNFKFVNLDFTESKQKKIFQRFTRKVGENVREISFVHCHCVNYGEILNEFHNMNILSIALPSSYDGFDQNQNQNYEYDENKNDLLLLSSPFVKLSVNRNLKCLEITGSSFHNDEENESINNGNENQRKQETSIDWMDFIKSFPNLEILGAQCRSSEDLTKCLSVLSTNPLKNLCDFSCVLTDMENSHLEMLKMATGTDSTENKKKQNVNDGCHLKTLDLSLSQTVDHNLLIALLRQHSKTIQSVKLFRDSESKTSPLLSVPQLMNGNVTSFSALNSLEIQCNMIESLDFISFTPNLKHLNLLQFGEGNVTFYNDLLRKTKFDLHNHKSVFPHLRSFSYEYFLAVDCLEKVASIFPNLIRMSCYLTDDGIRVIFKDMPHIEELTIFGSKVTDEGITGCALSVLQRKYRYMKDYRKSPYIGNMKKLRRLAFHPEPQEKITDFSVVYGFMDVESLTSMEMAETSISNEGVELLQQKKNLVTLITPFYVDRDGNIFSRPRGLKVL